MRILECVAGKHWYEVTQVDGCLCKNETAADFVVKKSNVGDVVVELKGVDVPRGVLQVQATAKFWKALHPDIKKIAGLIVCRQRPKYSTSIQRLQRDFIKTFKGPLHVVSTKCEFQIHRVLSFDGPH